MNKEIPEFLIKFLKEQYSEETVKEIIKGYSVNRKVSLRVNTLKSTLEEVTKVLEKNNIEFENAPWSNLALVIKNVSEKELEDLPIYSEGKIYLQSLSSMMPPIVLNPNEKTDILDMTAAPGGKTTQIAAITNNAANITACESNAIRAERLKYNVQKQGASRVFVMQKDSRFIDDFFSFDKILLDAPCSGSGTININDEKMYKTFTLNLIEKSQKMQKALIEKALKILKPGSEMVYSTCSILKYENEDIIQNVLDKCNCEIIPIDNFEKTENLKLLPTQIAGTICVCPNEYYEGFFIAKLKKNK